MRSLLLPLLASAATTVSAHGYVDNATINGQYYQFYQPYQDQYMGEWAPKRISRAVYSNGPVENVTSIDVQCGGISAEGRIGSSPAPLHAPAEAGSTVNLKWTYWPDSHMGPMLTYMARCPDSGCQDWLPESEKVWFKIHQDGRHTEDKVWPDDIWATTPFMYYENAGYNYTIPSCLKPGYYLVRHEIIALHSAWAESGAQFYPSCHQLQVSGEGTVVPTTGLVSFPGAYEANHPGIHVNVWNAGGYTIPGPEVFECPV
ncbi:family 61 putative glycoside hydrolase [Cladorrhinum samala]|uniref:lytic cellulose monooxygenase (C4-dehydrogenating) n=1 Tax=Cladorrhinum samala TaxID=585594 RepID=A0AAV9H7P1_9PEZI|nr:family 61 putative glycoside hydrolase [Cladorrhinum samala]